VHENHTEREEEQQKFYDYEKQQKKIWYDKIEKLEHLKKKDPVGYYELVDAMEEEYNDGRLEPEEHPNPKLISAST
jgi:hypothetical protein